MPTAPLAAPTGKPAPTHDLYPEINKPHTYAQVGIPTTIALHASGLVPVTKALSETLPKTAAAQPSAAQTRIVDAGIPIALDSIPETETTPSAPIRTHEESTEPATVAAQYRTALETLLAEIREHFSEDEMPDAPAVPAIPGTGDLKIIQRTAPALGWALLRALPLDVHTNPHAYAELFDRLQGRHGIAEAASSLGIEGDNSWHAAAITRITLAHNIGSVNTEGFWADSDIRWLLGVHEDDGTTYFNRERFATLLPWLELDPDTLRLVGDQQDTNESLLARAEAAGYRVAQFLHRPGFVAATHGFVPTAELLHA